MCGQVCGLAVPMASVKRRGDSQFWVACFTLPNGKRKQVSTHTTDEQEALVKANTYERTGNLAKKKRLDEATTRRVLQQIALAAGHEAHEVVRVRDFIDEQHALLAHTYQGTTLESYQYSLTHFRDDSGLADHGLHEVTPARAVEWKQKLIHEGIAKATINKQLGALRRAFRPAVQKEWIEKNPWDDLTIEGANKARQKREAFTFAQFEQLLAATTAEATNPKPALKHPGEWHLLILLGGYTGQRKTDCLQLEGRQVDLARGVVRYWRKKNKDHKEVPIHPALRPALTAAKKQQGDGKLLPNLAAYPPRGSGSISDRFRLQVLPLIGVDQPFGAPGKARTLAPLSFHSLRHALSTWLNNAGVSDVDRMQIVGHTDNTVSQGYTHSGLKNAKRALRKVPAPKRRGS